MMPERGTAIGCTAATIAAVIAGLIAPHPWPAPFGLLALTATFTAWVCAITSRDRTAAIVTSAAAATAICAPTVAPVVITAGAMVLYARHTRSGGELA